MSITRRSVIAGAATVGATLTLPESRMAAAAPAARTRYNATSTQGKAMLAKYAQAVTKMKALPKTDPRNWDFQWYTHWIPGPGDWQPAQPVKTQMINAVFAGKPANDPHRLLAKAMWDTCQAHASNPNDPNDFQEPFFLPWHRFVVFYFEEIIRNVLADNTFTLPYWSYLGTKASDRNLPPEFRDSGSPLYVANRNAWVNAGKPIDSDPSTTPISNSCFKEHLYNRFCSAIDGNPHGAVHVDTGTETNMGDVPTAAQDPIFWVHHCEIDRLWESWNRVANHKNPTWPNRSFVFADASGKAVVRACKDADRVASLGYKYDSYYASPFTPQVVPPAAMALNFNAAQQTTRAVGDGPLQLVGGGSRIALQPPPAIALPTGNLAAPAAAKPIFARSPWQQIYLVLGDIAIPRRIGSGVHLYLDLPEGQKGTGPSDIHYAGTLNFFGVHVRAPDAPHSDHQRTFNVTDTVQALAAKGLLTASPSVTAEPAGDLGSGTPVIGRVALVVE